MSDETPPRPYDPAIAFPLLEDAGGYRLQPRDTAFVDVSPEGLRAMVGRRAPLGFASPEQWGECLAALRAALLDDGLPDADIRLKGTASAFFSRNPSKPFPQSALDCRMQAESNALDGSVAEALWNRSPYADAGIRPTRAFWDSRQALGIDTEPSDYDIQISSAALAETLHAHYPDGKARGRSITSAHGGHYTHGVLLRTFPALAGWSERWTSRRGRRVNLAGFPSGGPSNPISRFKDEDWVIIP